MKEISTLIHQFSSLEKIMLSCINTVANKIIIVSQLHVKLMRRQYDKRFLDYENDMLSSVIIYLFLSVEKSYFRQSICTTMTNQH